MQQQLIICRRAAPINPFGWSMRLNHLPRRIPSTSKMKPPCRRIAERLHNLIKWISLGTEPEKIRQLVTETESRIADLIVELEIVRKTNQAIQEDKEKVEQIQSG